MLSTEVNCSGEPTPQWHSWVKNTTPRAGSKRRDQEQTHNTTRDSFYQMSPSICFTYFLVSEINKGKARVLFALCFMWLQHDQPPRIIFPPPRQVRWKAQAAGTGQ